MQTQDGEFEWVAEGVFENVEYFAADGFAKCEGCDAVHVEGG